MKSSVSIHSKHVRTINIKIPLKNNHFQLPGYSGWLRNTDMMVENALFNEDAKNRQQTTKSDIHRAYKIEFILNDPYYNSYDHIEHQCH